MPVYVLLEQMPYTELVKWISFFKRRPIGWQDDQRTFMLLKAQGVKGSAETLFPTLKIIKEQNSQRGLQEPDRAVPKGSFLDKMLAAKNGDNSGWRPK